MAGFQDFLRALLAGSAPPPVRLPDQAMLENVALPPAFGAPTPPLPAIANRPTFPSGPVAPPPNLAADIMALGRLVGAHLPPPPTPDLSVRPQMGQEDPGRYPPIPSQDTIRQIALASATAGRPPTPQEAALVQAATTPPPAPMLTPAETLPTDQQQGRSLEDTLYAQRMRREQAQREAAKAKLGTAEPLPGPAGDVVGVAHDLVTNPIGTVTHGVGEAFKIAGIPQAWQAGNIGEWVWRAANGDAPPSWVDAIPYGRNLYGATVGNLHNNELVPIINQAHEAGGDEAVYQALKAYGTQNLPKPLQMVASFGADVLTDPTLFVGGLGLEGLGREVGARAAMETNAARAALGETASRLLEAPQQVLNATVDLPFNLAGQGISKALGRLPEGIRNLGRPTNQAADEARATQNVEAIDELERANAAAAADGLPTRENPEPLPAELQPQGPQPPAGAATPPEPAPARPRPGRPAPSPGYEVIHLGNEYRVVAPNGGLDMVFTGRGGKDLAEARAAQRNQGPLFGGTALDRPLPGPNEAAPAPATTTGTLAIDRPLPAPGATAAPKPEPVTGPRAIDQPLPKGARQPKGLTPEQRSAAIDAGQISKWTPIPGGERLVDRAKYDVGARYPERYQAFLAEVRQPTQGRAAADKALEARSYEDYDLKQAEQMVTAAEHTVDVLAPAWNRAFGDVAPLDIPATTARIGADTPSGKASFAQEKSGYLIQRAAYDRDPKKAAGALSVLRSRWADKPWGPAMADRIAAIHDRLMPLYDETARTAPTPEPSVPTPGTVRLYRVEVKPEARKPKAAWMQLNQDASGFTAAKDRWFTDKPELLDFYAQDIGPEISRIAYVDVPRQVADQYRVASLSPEIRRYSRDAENEFFLPRELADQRQSLTTALPTPEPPASALPAPEAAAPPTPAAGVPQTPGGNLMEPQQDGSYLVRDRANTVVVRPHPRKPGEWQVSSVAPTADAVQFKPALGRRATLDQAFALADSQLTDAAPTVAEVPRPRRWRVAKSPEGGFRVSPETSRGRLSDSYSYRTEGEATRAAERLTRQELRKAEQIAAPAMSTDPARGAIIHDAYAGELRTPLTLPNGDRAMIVAPTGAKLDEPVWMILPDGASTPLADGLTYTEGYQYATDRLGAHPLRGESSAANAQPAPATVMTPQGPQAVMDVGAAGRPVFGGPEAGLTVPRQTTAPALDLQAQVLDTPEARRQAETLAGQTDMFGAAPAPPRASEAVSAPTGDVRVPTAAIQTNPKLFQPREGLDEAAVQGIVDAYDPYNFDAIRVWRNPEDQSLTVIAGHHRLEAAKRLGLAEVPVRIFEGSLDRARALADASNNVLKQKITEDAAAVRRAVDERGSSIKEAAAAHRVTPAKAQQLYDIAYAPSIVHDLLKMNEIKPAAAATVGRIVREGRMSAAEAGKVVGDLAQSGRLSAPQLQRVFDGLDYMTGQAEQLGGMFAGMDLGTTQGSALIADLDRIGKEYDQLKKLDTELARSAKRAQALDVPLADQSAARTKIADRLRLLSDRLGRTYFLDPNVRAVGEAAGAVRDRAGQLIDRLPQPERPVSAVPEERLALPGESDAATDIQAYANEGRISQEAADLLNATLTVDGESTPMRMIDAYNLLLTQNGNDATAAKAELKRLVRRQAKLDRGESLLPTTPSAWQRFWQGYDTATTVVRDNIMFNVVTGARGSVGDQIGDAFTISVAHGVGAAAATFNPKRAALMVRYVRGTATRDDLGRIAEVRFLDDLGLGIPHEVTAVHGGRAEGSVTHEMTLHRGVMQLTGGKGRRVTGAVSGIFANQTLRDVRTALDQHRRLVVYADTVQRLLPEAKTRFRRLVDERAPALGENADTLWQRIDDTARARVEAEGRVYDGAINPEDVLQATGNTDLSRSWRHEVKTLDSEGRAEVKRVLFSYTQTNLDKQLSRGFLFHYWQSRALLLHTKTALKNPWLLAAYGRTWEAIKREAEQQGYPASLRSYINFLGDQGGWMSFMDPVGFLVPFTMFRELGDPGHGRAWENWLTKSGLFLNPLAQAAATAFGWSSRAPDPTGTWSVRNMVRATIDYGRNHGVDFLGAPGITGDPVTHFTNRVFETISGLAADAHIPFAEQVTATDPAATQISQVNHLILTAQEAKYGPSTGWTQAQRDETLEAEQAVLTGHAADNPIAKDALAAWSRQSLEQRGLAAAIPGGVRTVYGPRQTRKDTARAGYDTISAGGTATPEQETAILDTQTADAGSVLAGNLAVQQNRYYALGPERGQRANEMWGTIAYDPTGAIAVGGRTIPKAQLLAMSVDERKLLADQWIAEQGLTADLQAFRDARDAFKADPANADYAAYDAWASGARKYGPSQFREKMMKISPSYAAYIDSLPKDVRNDPAQLDQKSVSVDAYLSTQGEKQTVYSPPSPPTLDISKADPSLFVLGGPGGADTGQAPQNPAQRLAGDLQRYQTDVLIFNQTLKTLTGNPNASWDGMNPMLQQAWARRLSDMGIRVPQVPGSVAAYQRWIAAQPPGADTSIAAYVAWQQANPLLAGGSGGDVNALLAILNGGR